MYLHGARALARSLARASSTTPRHATPTPRATHAPQYHAMGNATAGAMVYGDGPGSLVSNSTGPVVASPGTRNDGAGLVGFVACGGINGPGGAMPRALAKYCGVGGGN